MQPNLSSHQTRWCEYISRFNFTIQHVDGTSNRVADCLSRYYESDYPDDKHPDHEFVSADARLDPDAELLPVQRYVELCSAVARQSCRLAEQVKQCVLDSNQMNDRTSDNISESSNDDSLLAIESGTDGHSLRINVERNIDLVCIVRKHYHEDTVFVKVLECPHLRFGI